MLPIELLYFSATLEKEKVVLRWETASEINADHYVIEKSSDGIEYKTMAIVSAKGFADNYILYDRDPYVGRNYYRLTEIDMDFQHSEAYITTISVGETKFKLISIHPIPSTQNVYVSFVSESETPVQLEVLDVLGRSSIQITYLPQVGENTTTLNLGNLPKGIYYLKLYQDNNHNPQSSIIIKE